VQQLQERCFPAKVSGALEDITGALAMIQDLLPSVQSETHINLYQAAANAANNNCSQQNRDLPGPRLTRRNSGLQQVRSVQSCLMMPSILSDTLEALLAAPYLVIKHLWHMQYFDRLDCFAAVLLLLTGIKSEVAKRGPNYTRHDGPLQHKMSAFTCKIDLF
jgi:hypothetical protein